MTHSNNVRLDFFAKLLGLIAALITLVSAVIGLGKVWQGDMGFVTVVLLVIGAAGAWLGCAYFTFKRTPPLVKDGKGTWQHPRLRPLTLIGLLIIPLLVVCVVTYSLYWLPSQVIFLVANFDGPDPQKYRITETIIARLRQALAPYEDVQVETLGRAITEVEGTTGARAEGEKRKATIVIWGWYGVTTEVVPVSVHFEVLRHREIFPELGATARGEVQTPVLAELESFALQTNLSAEMTYLTLFTVGIARFARADWDGAASRFSDVLSQSTEHVSALDRSVVYYYRALAYSFKGNYKDALSDLDQAIKLAPKYIQAYLFRGMLLYLNGDHDRAIADLDHAVRTSPDHLTYTTRGLYFYFNIDYQHAIADFDQSIKLKPDFADAYYWRGLTYYAKRDYDRAIADFDQSIKLKLAFANAYYWRGLTYYAKRDYDRAITDFDRLIELYPPKGYYGRCLTYYAKRDYDHAIADCREAIDFEHDYTDAYILRGDVYRSKGDFERAISDYDQAIRLRPYSVEAYIGLGSVYYHKDDYERAIDEYNQAIQLKPDLVVAYYHRGNTFYRKHDTDRAIADWNQAIGLDPKFDPAYYTSHGHKLRFFKSLKVQGQQRI